MKKLEKLKKPKIDLKSYHFDPYKDNPLLKFNLNAIKKAQKCDILRNQAKQKIHQEYQKCLPVDLQDDVIFRSQSFYKNQLKNYVLQTPVPVMTKRIETKILSSVSPKHKLKYPWIVNTFMTSVRDDYHQIMTKYSTERVIKPDSVMPKNHFKFKFDGKTNSYDVFLKNRDKIRRKLLIFHPFIRCIVATSVKEFPQYLFDLANYRENNEPITILGLKLKVLQDIQSSSVSIQRTWYPKIGQILIKHYKKRSLPQKQWEHVLTCAAGLINRQLNEIKIRTIDRLVKVLADRKLFPVLKMTGRCEEGELLFSPTIQEIYEAFEEIIEEILSVGRYISPLFYLFDNNAQKVIGNPRWKIEIGDVYPVEVRKITLQTINETFLPITNYINDLKNTFYDLYSNEANETLTEFLSIPRSFDESFHRIEKLRMFLTKISDILNKEFFDTVIIYQSQISTDLKEIANQLMEPLTMKLFESHTNDNEDICKEFEKMKSTALKHPKSTEELIENGEYILYVKNDLLNELTERVQKSLQMMGILVELRELSPKQLSLQIKVISWLHRVKGVFEENASNYEYYKSIFEEKLLSVKSTLNVDIDDFLPMLSILNDMNDEAKLRDNDNILNGYEDKIKLMEDIRDWINKEETLFKFTNSKYPKLDDIKEFVGNFHTLIR